MGYLFGKFAIEKCSCDLATKNGQYKKSNSLFGASNIKYILLPTQGRDQDDSFV